MSGNPSIANRLEDFNGDGVRSAIGDYPVDDYATLLAGRIKTGDGSGNNRPLVTGRHGIDPWPSNDVYIGGPGVAMLAFVKCDEVLFAESSESPPAHDTVSRAAWFLNPES